MWGFNGVEHKKTIEGNITSNGEAAMIDDTYVTGKISSDHHPFIDYFKFVKQFEDENTLAKQTIPSPGQFYAYFTGAQLLRNTLSIYENEEAFAFDVVKDYIEFVHEIYDAGCRVLQFDDCVWGGMVNPQLARGSSQKLHTISTSSSGSKGFLGGDKIQATMVFERID